MNLEKALIDVAEEYEAPNGKVFRGISLDSVRKIARDFNLSCREVEIVALKQSIIPLRYQRNIGTLGTDGQIKLLESCVAVIGCGGLGGLLIELLARAGISELKVVDSKSFKEENLNRQILSSEISIGRMKAEVARERIKTVNSATEIETYTVEFDSRNGKKILSGVDVVVDALDSVKARLVLQDVARRLKLPLVSAAIAGFCGYVTVILPGDSGWRALYGGQGSDVNGVERELGNLGATAAVAASLETQEVIKLISGRGEILRNRFLFFDTERNFFTYIDVSESPKGLKRTRTLSREK